MLGKNVSLRKRLHWFEFWIDYKLDFLRDFVNENSEILKKKTKEIEQKYLEYEKNECNGGNPLTAFDMVEGDILSYDFYQKQVYNFCLVSIYSFFEYNLVEFCYRVSCILELEPEFENIKGNERERSWQFISKNLNIKSRTVENLWNQINQFRRIRNMIVHHDMNYIKDGDKPYDKQKGYNLIKNTKGIKWEKSGQFFVEDKQLLLDFCDSIRRFFIQLLEELEKSEYNFQKD